MKVDVLIVGGGMIGLSCGVALSRQRLRVLVVDAAAPGAATPWAGGMLSPTGEASVSSPALAKALVASAALYSEFVADLPGGESLLSQRGTLHCALHRDHLAELSHLESFQRDLGLPTRRLTATECRAREPALGNRLVGGLLSPDESHVDPRRLHEALRQRFLGLGGTLVVGQVNSLDHGPVAVHRVDDGRSFEVNATHIVVATGAFASLVAEITPRVVRGQAVLLGGPPPITSVVRTPDVYLVPREDQLFVGATSDEAGRDATPTAGDTLDLLRHAWAAVPSIDDMAFVETGVGFRPAVAHHEPVIGTVRPGLHVALGHYRHGIALAALTALGVTQAILGGDAVAALDGFRPAERKERAS